MGSRLGNFPKEYSTLSPLVSDIWSNLSASTSLLQLIRTLELSAGSWYRPPRSNSSRSIISISTRPFTTVRSTMRNLVGVYVKPKSLQICPPGISYLSLEEEKAVRAKIPALRAMDAAPSSTNGGAPSGPQEPGYSEVVIDAAAKEVVDKNVLVIFRAL